MPAMKAKASGNIVVIGATASRRGVAGTAAFAPAKMAQRALAESMARYLGPAGVHVSLLVVDGVVRGPESSPPVCRSVRPDSFIEPDAIAETALSSDFAGSFSLEFRGGRPAVQRTVVTWPALWREHRHL